MRPREKESWWPLLWSKIKKRTGRQSIKTCLPSMLFLKRAGLCVCDTCQGAHLHLLCSGQQLHPISTFGHLCLTFSLLLANIWEIRLYSLLYLFHDGFNSQSGETVEPWCCWQPRWGSSSSQHDGFWGKSWVHVVLGLFFKSRQCQPFNADPKER